MILEWEGGDGGRGNLGAIAVFEGWEKPVSYWAGTIEDN